MKIKGNLVVISGPSGSGKGTVCHALIKESSSLLVSVSATTRKPRGKEKDGIDYFFLTREHFEEMIAGDRLLEWADVYGNYYGTPREPVEKNLLMGRDVILEIDVQGGLQVKNKYPQCILIFLIPPSRIQLEARLRQRGTDSDESIARRLNWAENEIKEVHKYNYLIINDRVEAAARKIEAIVTAESCRPAQLDVEAFLKANW